MPLHLTPRRTFLRRAALAGAALFATRHLPAAEAGASSRWALLSDTHIGPKPETIARETNMADHLRAVVKKITALIQPMPCTFSSHPGETPIQFAGRFA